MLLEKFLRVMDLDRKGHTLWQSCSFQLLSGEELHPSQLPILWAISQTERISQGQIARVLGVSRAAVAVSTKRMEKVGLVKRERSRGDQRRTLISLTPKGAEAARRAKWIQESILAKRLEGFTPEEIQALVEFYERMNHNLEGYRRELERGADTLSRKEEVIC